MTITMEEVRKRIWQQAIREADKWYAGICQNNYLRYYLYVKESTETDWGDLRLEATDSLEGYKLAMPERFHGMLTKDMVIQKIVNASQSLPLIPFGN